MFYALKNNLMIIQTIQMTNKSGNDRFPDYYTVYIGLRDESKITVKLQFV